jgi:RNA polymerase sigma-70 factor (ECF subfamily)
MFGLNWLSWVLSFATFSVITYKDDAARPMTPEQQALLLRASRCDPAALTAVYDQYVGRIYTYIYRRVGEVELAEDLTGQVFMRMLEAVYAGRPWQTSFSGWLYRIAHNLVIDYYRRRGRATFVDIDEVIAPSPHGQPQPSVEAMLDSEQLRQALCKVTEEQAQVISLRFLEDLSIAETAEIMGKTEGAIKALQYRAVSALRRVMQP